MPWMGIVKSSRRQPSSVNVKGKMSVEWNRASSTIILNSSVLQLILVVTIVIYMSTSSASLPRRHRAKIVSMDYQRSSDESLIPREMFFSNDSLLGVDVPCTKEEKECLRYNRILFPADGRCYALGDGPHHCRFAVDQCEFERKGGHVQGKCVPTDVCRPLNSYQELLAYTGRCMKTKKLISACGPGPVNLVQHFFGGTECARPESISPETPVYIKQPAREGRCVFPNLRHDLTSVSNEVKRVRFRPCSQQQSVCFAKKRVWFAGDNQCYGLLSTGPCAVGERLVLNRTEWEGGRVRADCARVHPCGGASRLMAFDGRCYGADTVLRALCPGGVLLPNAFGEMACITRDFYRHVVDLDSPRPEACEVTQRVSFDAEEVAVNLVPECGLVGDGAECKF